MSKGFRQLTLADRLTLEKLLKMKLFSKSEIARRMGITRQTIYNELERGMVIQRKSDYTEEKRYLADYAQNKRDSNVSMRGTSLKIGKDIELANYIEDRIVDDGYSPEAVLGEIKVKGIEFKTSICVKTLYNYIDKGIFLRLTNKHLPVKRKRKYRKVRRQARPSAGESIENRPKHINKRKEFGHWEMDSVLSSRKGHSALVALTERKARMEIVFKAADHSADEVVRILDDLERKYGEMFPILFKTITVDNGSEFAQCEKMETSIHGGKRTKIYYCHPYCSSERGSNENGNRLIRRRFPKGTNFDNITDEEVKAAENWVNTYPRRIFKHHTAKERFEEEYARLAIP